MENQIRSLNTSSGDILLFTVIPEQNGLKEYIEEYPTSFGWKGDEEEGCLSNPSQEFLEFVEQVMKETTEKNTQYYSTVVPQGMSLSEMYHTQVFDKFLEKSYEEETGWLYELIEGGPETFEDNTTITVLNFDEDYDWWVDLELGVITKDMVG